MKPLESLRGPLAVTLTGEEVADLLTLVYHARAQQLGTPEMLRRLPGISRALLASAYTPLDAAGRPPMSSVPDHDGTD